MAGRPSGRKEPAGWLMRIRTIGPGTVRPAAGRKGSRDKGDKRTRRRADERLIGSVLEPEARKKVAASLRSLIKTYPFGLLAASVGAQDLDLMLRCPMTDLALIADLVKQRLMPTIREAGLGGRFWRKGFLRRALGTQGEVRRALVLLRQEARIRRNELIDLVKQDENLGVRTRRPSRPIEQNPPSR
jgi:hypothetical protein